MRDIGILLLTCVAAAGAAQSASAPAPPGGPPPPLVDAALRDRVAKFFQAQADRKYRQADQYVAEDTKDYFYEVSKTPITQFQIAKIVYSEHFTKAVVTVQLERDISQPMFPNAKVKVPDDSTWKIENGLWCWTVDPTVVHTPFGDFKRPPLPAPGAAPNAVQIPPLPKPGDVNKTVSADRSEITLGPPERGQVVLQNSLPGPIGLALEAPEVAGLEVKLDHAQVGPSGSARVLFTYHPAPGGSQTAGGARREVVVNVVVQPTSQVIPIRVTLGPAAPSQK